MESSLPLWDNKPPALSRLSVPEEFRGLLRIGPCSWKFDSWKGIVYRANLAGGPSDYLREYARIFDCVEIDSWFWSLFPPGVKLPPPNEPREFAEAVPEDFLFSVKVPNSITLTHFYAKQPPVYADHANRPNPHFLDVSLMTEFLRRLDPMRSRLGPLILQFEYLNRGKMPSLEVFLEKLDAFFDQLPTGYSFAVEIRNPNFLLKGYFDFLRRRGLGVVLIEGYYMPPIAQVAAEHDIATGGPCVIRLQGTDRTQIEKLADGRWDRVLLPQDESLNALMAILRQNMFRKMRTFVHANNHFEGCAPLTLQRLIQRLN
ncbi:MAG: DUF72 domain-containing protein [Phycisphaerae bacterium]|nr:DUF72 domain-containing protein [Phycisphaerae bacterium]